MQIKNGREARKPAALRRSNGSSEHGGSHGPLGCSGRLRHGISRQGTLLLVADCNAGQCSTAAAVVNQNWLPGLDVVSHNSVVGVGGHPAGVVDCARHFEVALLAPVRAPRVLHLPAVGEKTAAQVAISPGFTSLQGEWQEQLRLPSTGAGAARRAATAARREGSAGGRAKRGGERARLPPASPSAAQPAPAHQ